MSEKKSGKETVSRGASERMVFSPIKPKPSLADYIVVMGKVDGKEIGGVEFAKYAFALEDYVMELEKYAKQLESKVACLSMVKERRK